MTTPARSRPRRVVDALLLLVVVAAAVVLWPAGAGGRARYLVVEGRSMEPTYHLGDGLVVWPERNPRVGDVIVFRVPQGEPGAGLVVVHRLWAVRPDGSFQTKGDNRDTPDMWHLTERDVLGTPRVVLPRLGDAVVLAAQPAVVFVCVFLLTLVWVWPRAKHRLHDVHLARVAAAATRAADRLLDFDREVRFAEVVGDTSPADASDDWMEWLDELVRNAAVDAGPQPSVSAAGRSSGER